MSNQDQVLWSADRTGELQVMRPPVIEFKWTEKGFALNKIDKLHDLLGTIDGADRN